MFVKIDRKMNGVLFEPCQLDNLNSDTVTKVVSSVMVFIVTLGKLYSIF